MSARLRTWTVAIAVACCLAASRASAADRDGFIYSAAIYDQRYDDTIYTLDALKPFGFADAALRPYADLLVNVDSQSLNQSIPSILTDNYALGALGAQYENRKGFRAFAQVGITARIGALDAREPGGDVRAGTELFRGWGGLTERRSTYGSYFGNATYIGRDKDAVLVDQLEEGHSFAAGHEAVDLYARANATIDTSHFYYSNFVEGGAGFRLRSFRSTGLTVTLEKSVGAYVRGAARPLGTDASYRDLRATASLGISF